MTLNQIKAAAEIARSRTSDKRWIAAIDRAVAGVVSGWWVITELHDGVMVTTETGHTYHANGACQCRAFELGQPCKHRALARLIELYNEMETEAPATVSPAPRYCGDRDLRHLDRCAPHIVRSVERDVITRRRVRVTRCNDWVI